MRMVSLWYQNILLTEDLARMEDSNSLKRIFLYQYNPFTDKIMEYVIGRHQVRMNCHHWVTIQFTSILPVSFQHHALCVRLQLWRGQGACVSRWTLELCRVGTSMSDRLKGIGQAKTNHWCSRLGRQVCRELQSMSAEVGILMPEKIYGTTPLYIIGTWPVFFNTPF